MSSVSHASSFPRSQAIKLLTSGASARSVAHILGLDTLTAQAWAAQSDIMRRHRSSKTRSAIISFLNRESSKVEIARALGISIQTVTWILCTEVELSERWHQAKQQKASQRARKTWSAMCRRHPNWGASQLRRVLPAVYAWLYRNDLDWLTSNSPAAQDKPTEQRVDWRTRDQFITSAISKAFRTHSTDRK